MICHLDCSTGVSGDKFLGALLDAGTANGAFTAEHLGSLVHSLAPEARVSVSRVRSHGIAALSVQVEAAEPPAHRHPADIERLIAGAALPRRAKERASEAFRAIAHAEAAAHGTSVESVHFHEVGALDSIVDVVGVCAGLEALGVTRLVATPIAVGGGTVRAAHGVLPVPAPATATLLMGLPIVPGPHDSELTTPTGAALARVCADGFGRAPAMTPMAVGYGAGTRDIGTPNVCRAILGHETAGTESLGEEDVTLLETNVDHLSPEGMAFVAEELLAEGALDAWLAPIVMKKGRPASLLSVLAARPDAEKLAARIVTLTGSLGVRRSDMGRFVAEREVVEIPTQWGPIAVKVGAGRIRPEHAAVARIARATGMPYHLTQRELEELAREFLQTS